MPAFIDLTGKQFGRLTVLARAENNPHKHTMWFCRCSCGVEKNIDAASLRAGGSRSCGCLKREESSKRTLVNLEGRQFGRLVVISRQGSNKYSQPLWLCHCSCGKESVTSSSHLVFGSSRSCGCLKKELARNICKTKTGVKNNFWKGGVTAKHLLARSSPEQKNWRKLVLARDAYRCQECGAGGHLHAHHIKPFASFPELRLELSNGQTLCAPCHKKTPTYASNKK